MPKPLTDRQKEIFDYIESYIDDDNRPPTIAEIKKTFGFRSPQSVVDHLNALQKKGYIKRLPNSRGIVILTEKRYFPILGRVAAGTPIPTDEDFDGTFSLEDYYEPESTFVLHIRGDSMKDVGICDGDMVLIKSCQEVRPGEICVAVLNGEYTVKRFLKENDNVVLRPENPKYKPIVITEKNADGFGIIGKVVGVHRILK